MTGATGPEIAAPVQARLDAALERVDQEMARAMADYDAAREELAAHHDAMEKQAASAERDAAALRPGLEQVVLGGKAPGKDFAEDSRDYLAATGAANQARTARRMAFPATQPPGAGRHGQPLGGPEE